MKQVNLNHFRRSLIAYFFGMICHGSFLLAGCMMFVSIYTGLTLSFGGLEFPWSWVVNLLLLLQFPLGHSYFLTKDGRKVLNVFAPKIYAKDLQTSTYVTISSLQLLLLFCFWTPSNIIIYKVELFLFLDSLPYLISWLLLSLASVQAGWRLQTGFLGWYSVLKGRAIIFPPMPVNGLFTLTRQPIYLAFCLVLWSAPIMTLDLFILAFSYTIYCYFAPRLKEKRFQSIYGQAFETYKSKVPYFLPRTFFLNKNEKV